MILEIIRRALKLSEFDKEVSFDRLFPNQDSLAKDGLGNLIALPLQGQATNLYNTLFLDVETFQPYADQWEFLKTIHRHSAAELDAASSKTFNKPTESYAPSADRSTITVVLNNRLTINRLHLSSQITRFLKEKLNFINTEYLIKSRLGKSVYKVQKFFKLIEEDGDNIFLPRGFLSQLVSFLAR